MNKNKVQEKKKKMGVKTIPNKKIKRKKSRKLLITTCTIMVLILGIGIFSLTTPTFNITNIVIEGNENVSTETILSLSEIKKEENIFRINKNSTISKIKENKYIENVKISRKLPGTLKILVEERTVQYQVNLINSYAYIDKAGYILENSTIKAETPVLVGLQIDESEILNRQRLDTEDLEKLNDINQIMEAAKGIEIESIITEINTEDTNDYIIYIESKNKKIHIGDTTNLTNKMLYVNKMLENEEGKSGIFFVNGNVNSGFNPYFREE